MSRILRWPPRVSLLATTHILRWTPTIPFSHAQMNSRHSCSCCVRWIELFALMDNICCTRKGKFCVNVSVLFCISFLCCADCTSSHVFVSASNGKIWIPCSAGSLTEAASMEKYWNVSPGLASQALCPAQKLYTALSRPTLSEASPS